MKLQEILLAYFLQFFLICLLIVEAFIMYQGWQLRNREMIGIGVVIILIGIVGLRMLGQLMHEAKQEINTTSTQQRSDRNGKSKDRQDQI